MKQADVLAEIARVEEELERLKRDLVALRKKVDGGSSRKTQAFSRADTTPPSSPRTKALATPRTVAPSIRESAPPAARFPSTAPNDRSSSEPPVVVLPPTPAAGVKTGPRAIADARREATHDTVAPPPADGRANRESDAGRYNYVADEGRPKSSRRGS